MCHISLLRFRKLFLLKSICIFNLYRDYNKKVMNNNLFLCRNIHLHVLCIFVIYCIAIMFIFDSINKFALLDTQRIKDLKSLGKGKGLYNVLPLNTILVTSCLV